MKKSNLLPHPGYSILAAVCYCLPLFFFIYNDRFASIWLLYLGNVLFGFAIALFMLHHTKNRGESTTKTGMIATGALVSVAGIVISAAVALLLVLLFAPHHSATSGANASGQYLVEDLDKSNPNLIMVVVMNLFIGNVAAGMFASVIFAAASK